MEPKSTRANLEKLANVKKNIVWRLSSYIPTFQVEMVEYRVSLSVIGTLQQNYQVF